MSIRRKVLLNCTVYAALSLFMTTHALVQDHHSDLHTTPPQHFLSDR